MIISLNEILRPMAENSYFKPISYSYGDENALGLWIESKNKKVTEQVLKKKEGVKYPLIWLIQKWQGRESFSGQIEYNDVSFFIACNSDVSALSEDRIPNFEINYLIANAFVSNVKKTGIQIPEGSVFWTEKGNYSTESRRLLKENNLRFTDPWDCLILDMQLNVNSYCLDDLVKKSQYTGDLKLQKSGESNFIKY